MISEPEKTYGVVCSLLHQHHIAVSSRDRVCAFGLDGRPVGPLLEHKGTTCMLGALMPELPLAFLSGKTGKELALVNTTTGKRIWQARLSSEAVAISVASPRSVLVELADFTCSEYDLEGQVLRVMRGCYSAAVDPLSRRAVVVTSPRRGADTTLELRGELWGEPVRTFPIGKANTNQEVFTPWGVVFQVLGEEHIRALDNDGRERWRTPPGEGFCLALCVREETGGLYALRRQSRDQFTLAELSWETGTVVSSKVIAPTEVGTEPVFRGKALLGVSGSLLWLRTGGTEKVRWEWERV